MDRDSVQLGVPAAAAALAPHGPPALTAGAGVQERDASPWLGRGTPPSHTFQAYQRLERDLSLWAGAIPDAAIAPSTAIGAYLDWWVHLVGSPAKQWELATYGAEQWTRALRAVTTGETVVQPLPQDKRFDDNAWTRLPYHGIAQAFLLRQQWWSRATTGVPGVTRHHEQMVSFAARQCLDMVAPSNFLAFNPVVQQRTLKEGGMNLLRGMVLAAQDALLEAADQPPAGAERYKV